MPYSRILVPIDESGLSVSILPLARGLCRALSARPVLFTAGDDAEFGFRAGDRVAGQPAHHRVRIRRRLDEIVVALKRVGLNPEVEIAFGDAAAAILSAARRLKCDLIVMATHARSPIVRGFLGSTADQVLRRARVPVLVLGPRWRRVETEEWAPKAIVVGLDGSMFAESTLRPAWEIGRALHIPVHFVRVLAFEPVEPETYHETEEGDRKYLDEFEEAAGAYISRVALDFRMRGVHADGELRYGRTATQLVECAKARSGAIIALATRGRSGLARWVLGSVTDEVVRAGVCPVLVAPHPAGKREGPPQSEPSDGDGDA